MRAILIFSISFLLLQSSAFCQGKTQTVQPPVRNDFAPIQSFLASEGLEGRETGTRGGNIAADYIAAMMQNMGLKPIHKTDNPARISLSDYYQNFELVRSWTASTSLEVSSMLKNHTPTKLLSYRDYTLENAFQSISVESAPVFAGYGINSADLGYNDYAGRDVKGKVVVLLDGYPGQHDTLSVAFRKFKTMAEADTYDLGIKSREAARQGAAAILIIDKNYLKQKDKNKTESKTAASNDPPYQDSDYRLPETKTEAAAACILLTETGSNTLAEVLGINFKSLEQEIAQHLTYTPFVSKNIIHASFHSGMDTITVHNLVGLLPGKDTTQTVIVGAHYDHLGKRGNLIYCGSDDNASGVAGMLALVKIWTESRITPPYNILFASWTAEEKGLIGSEYFTSKLSSPEKVKLYINMDMISRSAPEDTAHRIISIGTRPADEALRSIAKENNALLQQPFTLDLWDVTGHTGSDYASFTAKNIPVMTFFSGFHDDYHTPRDISGRSELQKMGDILKVVNGCLLEYLKMGKEE